MDRPRQRTEGVLQQCRSYHDGRGSFLGLSFLLLFAGCAQFDQLIGKQAAPAEPQPLTQSADSAPSAAAPEPARSPAQVAEPAPKPAAKKKTDGSHPASVTKEPPAPAAGPAKQMEQADKDKILAEKDQPKTEKKSRVAADKKSTKKSPKSQAESKPPTEDVFLSPIPLPSKPAAIGGSGG